MILLLSVPCTNAQDTAVYRVMQPMLVTGTRLEDVGSTSPAPEERIDAARLAADPVRSLADVLGTAAGTALRLYGADGGLQTASVRGLGPEYAIVYFNGIRLNDAQNGLVNTTALRLTGIGGITIARGGFSSLYGADAAGGVISIQTAPSGPRLEVTAGTGSYGRRSIEGSTHLGIGTAGVRLSAFYEEADNDYPSRVPVLQPAVMAIRDNAGFLTTGARGELVAPIAASVLTAFGQYSRLEAGIPGAWLQVAQGRAHQGDREALAGAAWRLSFARDWTLTLSPSLRWTWSHYLDPDLVSNGIPLDTRHENLSLAFTAGVDARLSDIARGAAGLEITAARLRSDGVAGEPQRTVMAAYATMDLRILQHVHIFPSIRLDHARDLPGETSHTVASPGVGLTWDPIPDRLTVRMHGSLGFRLPTFNQLYWNPGGNPDLRPERSRSIDAGLLITPADWPARFEATVFVHDITDRIVWAPGAGQIWRPTNIQHVLATGIEATTGLRLWSDDLVLRCSAQWTNAVKRNAAFAGDNTAGRMLVYVPIWSGTASLIGRPVEWLSVSALERITGTQYTTEINDAHLPAFAVTDLAITGTMHIAGGLILRVKGEVLNLFDADYQVIAWFPMPPRNYRLSITTSLP